MSLGMESLLLAFRFLCVTLPGPLGPTLLHNAIKQGNSVLTKALIQAGANPNRKSDMGKNPSHVGRKIGAF
jgi:ankyrin repeat protein